MMHIN